MTTPICDAPVRGSARATSAARVPALNASISRRVANIGSPHSQCFQLAVPRSPVRPDEQPRRLRVADDLFLFGVPAKLAAKTQRDIRQVTGRCHSMGALQVGEWFLSCLDAIEEVARVPQELRPRITGFILNGLRPQLVGTRLHDALRAADGMGAGE